MLNCLIDLAQFGMFKWVPFCGNNELYGYKRTFHADLVNGYRSICSKVVTQSLKQVSHHSMGFWQYSACFQMANLTLRPKCKMKGVRSDYIKTKKCKSIHYIYFTITMFLKYYNHHQELENYINSQSPLRITPCFDLFISFGKHIDLSIKTMLFNG